jgi:SsrA-binding protein
LNNRKASFNYELLERLEAGIELVGSEVKSLRAGRGSLDGAYVLVREGEAWLIGMTISPYQPGNAAGAVEQLRERKLLLTKQEIAHLAGLQNLTIVPISVYNKGRKIKLEIALARGKKKFDKRQTLKKRDTERNVRREHSDR